MVSSLSLSVTTIIIKQNNVIKHTLLKNDTHNLEQKVVEVSDFSFKMQKAKILNSNTVSDNSLSF